MEATESCYLSECTFVILGGTGDLSKRKLLPALYKMIADQRICKFSVMLVSFSETTVDVVLTEAATFIKGGGDQNIWDQLKAACYYHQLDFHDSDAYEQLKLRLDDIEKKHNLIGNRIFYLATMPHHFSVITRNFLRHGIVHVDPACQVDNKEPWVRVVYEKPFGNDLKSAKALNKSIEKSFCKNSIFRIDNYLGKELVGNIAFVRFTNRVFEPLWNNKHVESIHIVLSETLGIEQRGAFYDSCGALKDMIQSHGLQILALVAMEAPEHLSAEYLRAAKVAVLKKLAIKKVIMGQYEGYQQESMVKPDSTTETFIALQAVVNNKRWKDVPFYITTGKCLNKKEASITIKFKSVKCLLDCCPAQTNALTIKIAPDEGFYLGLNVKKPGSMTEVTPVSMDFCHSCLFGPNTPEAYEILLEDIVKGDQSTFLQADEIEWAWKFIAQVEKLRGFAYPYKKGMSGPEEAGKLYE